MKKLTSVAIVVGALLAFAGPASALDPVVEDWGCSYAWDPTTGFNAEGPLMWATIAGLEPEGWPASWTVADIETMVVWLEGDGIPDRLQLDMLGYVMCSVAKDAAGIVVQFEANVAEFEDMLANLDALFTSIGTDAGGAFPGDTGDALASNLLVVGQALLDLGTLIADDDLIALGTELLGAGALFDGFMAEYGIVPAALGPFPHAVAGLAGLSTEAGLTWDLLLGDLLEELDGIDLQLLTIQAYVGGAAAILQGQIDDGLAGMIAGLEGLGCSGTPGTGACANADIQATYDALLLADIAAAIAAMETGGCSGTPGSGICGMDPAVEAMYQGLYQLAMLEPIVAICDALVAEIGVVVPLLAIPNPVFEVFGGGAKTADEPFSALGDFDGNGISNGDEYDAVIAGGGTDADFIRIASGGKNTTDAFLFPGVEPMPVAGLLGLAILGGAVAIGGAFIIRRKK